MDALFGEQFKICGIQCKPEPASRLAKESITAFDSTVVAFNNLTEERDRCCRRATHELNSTHDRVRNIHCQCSITVYKELNSSEVQEEDWPWKMIWKSKMSLQHLVDSVERKE